ncbi:MAG: ATP-binding protein [Candidatus Gastranaerophilales bacterium]|nr:ATP-binding protein [Candidatus Gastranaerophilales bacterium]
MRVRFNKITNFLTDVMNSVNSVRYGNLSARVDTNSPEDAKNLSESINRMIETLNDRENMIVEYQAELTKQNKFLEALINSLSDGILVLDENYKIINASKKILEWLKLPVIIGTNVFEFIKVPDGKNLIELNDDEVFLKGNKDLYFKASIKKIEAKEHHDKYMVVVNNYTNQKEIESLKEDFVATLTHDLKVPIIAEANMLEFFLSEKFGKLNEKQKEALNTMQSSNKELLDLVQIVLDTYKIKEGEIELNIEPVSIKGFLDEIVDEMRAIALKTNNNLVVRLRSDFKIEVDYLQFKRVLKNLVNNAISYGSSNTDIELIVKRKWDNILITVKDYGKGIEKDDIDKIFNRYFSASRKFRKIGTGLGLYLSQKIVQAHGGKLTVSSKAGEYTEFCISLPV